MESKNRKYLNRSVSKIYQQKKGLFFCYSLYDGDSYCFDWSFILMPSLSIICWMLSSA